VGLDQIVLAPLTAEDWPAAARVYEAGIAAGNATFEPEAPPWDEWTRRRADYPAVVARDSAGEVLGWAALTPVSPRAVYRGVGAVSIYVAPEHTRRGVGRALLEALAAASEQAGFWTLEAGIFPENAASVALHASCGFRLVGVRERIGQMPDGRWRDVLLYERRSTTVGREQL
jgi:phosphinothricin acetyltransferase